MNKHFPLKYKPLTINQYFIGVKDNIVSTKSIIKTLLELDDINILFVGNICCGKTTLLNIMIREYYGISLHDNIPDNNILYINNLKEQGISFFRSEMKTHSQSRSSIFGKKKMIVIDDIDCINEQSQQVFRNHIDKYKKNIHFISVCTNIQKVIESFQSRVHIIKLEQPTQLQLKTLYDNVVLQENIIITKEAEIFLLSSKKSFRDLLNQMEKMYILDRTIDLETCKSLCSEVNDTHFITYITFLQNNQLLDAIKIMHDINHYCYSVIDIYDYLFTFIKTTDLINEKDKYLLIPLFCNYITIFHSVHEDPIELILFTNRIFEILFTKNT